MANIQDVNMHQNLVNTQLRRPGCTGMCTTFERNQEAK